MKSYFKSYFQGKEISLSNLLQIDTDDANAITDRHNGFIAKMKEITPLHVLTINCIIHRQKIASKSPKRERVVSNWRFHLPNFVQLNTLKEKLFSHICKNEGHQALLLHTKVRWLSKNDCLTRFVQIWNILLLFVDNMHFQASRRKQGNDKLEVMNDIDTKTNIFYLFTFSRRSMP